MAKNKAYCANLDGIHEVMVAAPSQKEAAKLIGITVDMMREWDAGVNDHGELIALSKPGQLFRKKGINGQWQQVATADSPASESTPITKDQFDSAVERLLGAERYSNLLRSGYNRPDFCREIAQDAFIGQLLKVPTSNEDIAIIQRVATRLWIGDGVAGLAD
ncbi:MULTISPECIES: hypothetical protein [Pseudomonas]|uniref:hypothetical protein n=1 Tax=Pseudomonas TaxID=286 RepID=UPI001981F0F2|nr:MULTISPECIES: hypothetical protein [Pseudomonas]WNZ87550.1 hypothetical protein QOM10_30150 [Pseudomonas sp. P108]